MPGSAEESSTPHGPFSKDLGGRRADRVQGDARELLEAGERDIVLQYVDLCRMFWLMDLGNTGTWKKIINSGRVPNFGPHLVY